jgi:hypothetical protein
MLLTVEVWVAGADVAEALSRRRAVERQMERRPIEHVGSGCGRMFYDLWCEQTGKDPLAGQGDVIADAEFQCATPALSDLAVEALAESIVKELEVELGFAVAVNLTLNDGDGDADVDGEAAFSIDPDAPVLVLITERDHAHLLAALRRVTSDGGLEGTLEAEIAENGCWDVMSNAELVELGDRFNSSAVISFGCDRATPAMQP